MAKLLIEQLNNEILGSLKEAVEICAADGRVLGRYFPKAERLDGPHFNDEEMNRISKAGGGRPLKDILADLEAGR